MDLGLHRHDITDNMWDLIKDHLPGKKTCGEVWHIITEDSLTQYFGY